MVSFILGLFFTLLLFLLCAFLSVIILKRKSAKKVEEKPLPKSDKTYYVRIENKQSERTPKVKAPDIALKGALLKDCKVVIEGDLPPKNPQKNTKTKVKRKVTS